MEGWQVMNLAELVHGAWYSHEYYPGRSVFVMRLSDGRVVGMVMRKDGTEGPVIGLDEFDAKNMEVSL